MYRLVLLLGYPDSNQERQDQNLQCYHYTIAQSISGAKVLLFWILQTFLAVFLSFITIFLQFRIINDAF